MFPSLLPPSPFKTPSHLCSDGKEVPWFPPRSAVTESGLCSLPELKSSCVYLCHPPGSTTEASLSSIRISPLLGSGHHRLSPGLLPPTEAPAPRLTFLQPTFLLSTHNRFGHQALHILREALRNGLPLLSRCQKLSEMVCSKATKLANLEELVGKQKPLRQADLSFPPCLGRGGGGIVTVSFCPCLSPCPPKWSQSCQAHFLMGFVGARLQVPGEKRHQEDAGRFSVFLLFL